MLSGAADGAGRVDGGRPPDQPFAEPVTPNSAEEGSGRSRSEHFSGIAGSFLNRIGAFVRPAFPVLFGGDVSALRSLNTDVGFRLIEAKSGALLRVHALEGGGLTVEGDLYDLASFVQMMLKDDAKRSGSAVYRASVDWSLSSVARHIRGDVPDGAHEPNFGTKNLTFSPYLNHGTGLYGAVLHPGAFSRIPDEYERYFELFMAKKEREVEESVRNYTLTDVVMLLETMIAQNTPEREAERISGMLNPAPFHVEADLRDADGNELYWKDAGIRLSSGGKFLGFAISFVEEADKEGEADVRFVGRPSPRARTIEWGVTNEGSGLSATAYFVKYFPVFSALFAHDVGHAVDMLRSTDSGNNTPPTAGGVGGVEIGGLMPSGEDGDTAQAGGTRMAAVKTSLLSLPMIGRMFAGAAGVFVPKFIRFGPARAAAMFM